MSEKKQPRRNRELEQVLTQRQKSRTDPQGSWTGVPWDEDEEPVQDADDL